MHHFSVLDQLKELFGSVNLWQIAFAAAASFFLLLAMLATVIRARGQGRALILLCTRDLMIACGLFLSVIGFLGGSTLWGARSGGLERVSLREVSREAGSLGIPVLSGSDGVWSGVGAGGRGDAFPGSTRDAGWLSSRFGCLDVRFYSVASGVHRWRGATRVGFVPWRRRLQGA